MHRHRVREIAAQAGSSSATVDRVLNRRPGVRSTTAAQVQRAITELDQQHEQIQLGGRTFLVDLVMQAPQRFSSAVRTALEAELPGLRPAVIRSRFHFREAGSPAGMVAILEAIGRRGSSGVLLKAPEDPAVVEAVDAFVDLGIPVATLVTDLPLSRRIGYIGIDNRAAGRHRRLSDRPDVARPAGVLTGRVEQQQLSRGGGTRDRVSIEHAHPLARSGRPGSLGDRRSRRDDAGGRPGHDRFEQLWITPFVVASLLSVFD